MSVFRTPVHAGFVILTVMSILVSGCGRHHARVNVPAAPARAGTTETGVASWYGIPYHGRRAASGEIFDMNAPTAAHRKLPFQTWVEVTNLSNGKRIDVRINDRGPFVRGRIIDLSQAAARDIDMLRPGIARVRLKVIAPPKEPGGELGQELARQTQTAAAAAVAAKIPAPTASPTSSIVPTPSETLGGASVPIDRYAVQAGAFADRNRAESLRDRLEEIFMDSRVIAGEHDLWRVLVGREMTAEQANELAMRVRQESGDALVVREPFSPQSDPTTPK